jgi:hypothetical protein
MLSALVAAFWAWSVGHTHGYHQGRRDGHAKGYSDAWLQIDTTHNRTPQKPKPLPSPPPPRPRPSPPSSPPAAKGFGSRSQREHDR